MKEEGNLVIPNNLLWAGQFGNGTACLYLDSLYFPEVCPRRRGFSGTDRARACPYLNSRDSDWHGAEVTESKLLNA